MGKYHFIRNDMALNIHTDSKTKNTSTCILIIVLTSKIFNTDKPFQLMKILNLKN